MPMYLNEDQAMLRDSAREFLKSEAPVSHLRKLRDDIMKIEERLQKEGVAMSRDQGQALTDERDAKMIEFRSLQQILQQRLQQSQEELQAAMSPKLEKAVTDLAKEKGYDLVLVKQAVLFSSATVDITAEVTKQINRMK